MNKRALHHLLVKLRELRYRDLMLAFVVLLLVSAFFLRQNNLHMISLRDRVQQADQQDKSIQQSMTNLRNYIAAHMNTGMGEQGVYLQYSYQRAYDAAVAQAVAAGGSSAVIYKDADQTCQNQFGKAAYGVYTQCVTDKVIASGAPAISTPPADLYRFNFVSPAWSPDLAGFTLLATILVALLLLGRMVLTATIYALLRVNR